MSTTIDENVLLFSTVFLKQKEYWINKLSADMAKTAIRFSSGTRDSKVTEICEEEQWLPSHLCDRLLKLCKNSDLSIYIMLTAALKSLIFRYTGNTDITIISPINKSKVNSETINDRLLIRDAINAETTFKQMVFKIRQSILEAYNHQDYPFWKLAELLFGIRIQGVQENESTSGDSAVSDIVCSLNTLHSQRNIEELPGKLFFLFHRQEDRICINLKYDGNVYGSYDGFYIRQTVAHFIAFLGNALDGLDQKTLDIPYMNHEEKDQLILKLNDTHTKGEHLHEKLIHNILEEQVTKSPDETAVVFGTQRLTFFQLNTKAEKLAGWLQVKGVKPDSIVAIMVEPSLELIIGIFGILKAGGAFLPIDPELPKNRIDIILEDSQTQIVVSRKTVLLDITSIAERLDIDCELNFQANSLPSAPITESLTSENLLYVIYTSGTTGKPKGVLLKHENLSNYFAWFRDAARLTFADRTVLTSSYAFDLGYTSIFPSLLAGGQLHIISRDVYLMAESLIDYISEHCITYLKVTPSLFKTIVDDSHFNEDTCRSLRLIVMGGEAIVLEDVEKAHQLCQHIAFINHYGPTETTIGSVFKAIDFQYWPEYKKTPVIGKPIRNTRVYILDKYLTMLPFGLAGELCISGTGMARGYFQREELTAEKFAINPFAKIDNADNQYNRIYRTGDLARRLPDGEIEFLGRIDHQVKIRGYRIELGEIENRLVGHPGIKETVVITRENKIGDKDICAYIVIDQQCDPLPSVTEIREYLGSKLPDYMIPSYFVHLDKIPLTPNGKINRKTLPEPIIRSGEGFIAPTNDLEKKLAEIWAEILGIESHVIGVDSGFFELGGHSLRATVMMAKIQKAMNVRLKLGEIFQRATIRELARYIKTEARKDRFASIEPTERKEYYPISPAQKRLYILQQIEPYSTAYNIPELIPLDKLTNSEKLEETFIRLIQRHESLRTSFHMIYEKPVQRIHEQVTFKIDNYKDIDAKDAAKDFIRPFDLSCAPLVRAAVIETKEIGLQMMVDMHHIISDGVSHTVLEQEFYQLYQERTLAPLRIQYKDYSQWLNSPGEQENIRKQEAYWLNAFAGVIPTLQLPYDFPRPSIQSFKGNAHAIALGREETAALKRLALLEDTTLFMVLLSLCYVLFFKLSKQEDIIVGTPVAGRRHADLEQIIGMFVNTLALRNSPTETKPFKKFFKEVAVSTLEAFENQEYQFEDLVDKVSLNRDIGRNPLFDVLFTLRTHDAVDKVSTTTSIPESDSTTEALSKSHEVIKQISKFDLSITGIDSGERLIFEFRYCTDLFKSQTIERFGNYFKRIIAHITVSPELPLAQIEIISREEKEKVLYRFNTNPAAYPSELTIHHIFAQQVEKKPDNIAVTLPAEDDIVSISLTYRQLDDQSNRVADLLIERGVIADTIIGVLADRSHQMIIAILGILKAGGAYLPIDPEYPEDRKKYMLSDSNARLLITTAQLVKTIAFEREVLEMDNLPKPTFPFCVRLQPPDCGPTHLAYVIYTSGTTGRPKGSLIEHRNVVSLMRHNTFLFNFGPNEVWTMFHSYCFDFSVWEMYGALLFGGRLVLISRMTALDSRRYLEILREEQVTILNQTPASFYTLVDWELKNPDNNLILKYVIFGGEALKPAMLKKWHKKYPDTRLVNMFGITETTVHVTFKLLNDRDISLNISNIGRPIPTLNTYVLDNCLKPVPIGVPGELFVGGHGVCRGYLNQPQLTHEKFVPNPYRVGERLYRSGDLGKFERNGDIEYLGRLDHQVKIRGFRIELGEIENRILKYHEVKEVVLTVRDDAPGGETDKYLCAYIVPEIGKEVDTTGLRGFIGDTLPDYMIPTYFVTLPKIPLTQNGKVDRQALPAPTVVSGARYAAARDEIENTLVQIWIKILGSKTPIGIDDDFFQLGGHSLRATVMTANVHKELNVKLPLVQVFTTPTIRGLAEYIRGASEDRFATIQPAESKEYYRLSFSQKRMYLAQQVAPESTAYNMPKVIPLVGTPNSGRLQVAFLELIRRHESLRTVFHMEGEEPVQVILPKVPFKIAHLDGTDQAKEKVRQFIQPFHLSTPPLLRAAVVNIENDQYLLLVDMHHIISDGVSQDILTRDFTALYEGIQLPPLKIQYKDFAEWQGTYAIIEAIRRQEAFWLEQFSGEIPVLNLPTDFPRPEIPMFEGGFIHFDIDASETQALNKLALEEGATLYMVLMSAFNIFLAKICGQEDIIIGTALAGRRHTDLQDIIGLFLNPLAMRNFPESHRTFKAFLLDVKERTMAAFENQDYPFEELVTKTSAKRSKGRQPIFAVMFGLQNLQNAQTAHKVDKPAPEPPPTEPQTNETKIAKYDMIMLATETANGLSFYFEYAATLFKIETIQTFIKYYKRVVSSVLQNPETTINDIQVISEEEEQSIQSQLQADQDEGDVDFDI